MTNVIFNTAGDGYWSRVAKKVEVTDLRLGYVNDEGDFGELRVYFDTGTWNVSKHGLIYTDSLFLTMLREKLTEIGFDGSDVDYSEQGMQGDNYVSLDVGKDFLDSWAAKYGVDSLTV
jgi:hypothetical protein